MGSFRLRFKKVGGVSLLKDYARNGVLLYACSQLMITGTSIKSLELLRNGVSIKIYKKLYRKYRRTLEEYNHQYGILPKKHSNKVWVCWMQGMENAPALVQCCFQSLCKNLKDREVVLITASNMKDYADIPSYILEKYEQGVITHTHFSDLLRIELLCRHGGTWIDSTVFCSGGDIPSYMLNSELFLFQNLKPGADGSILNVSSWFITACANNKILLAVRALLWKYWKENNFLVDYFLLHHFIMMVSEFYDEEWRKTVQFPNSFPHILLLMLFEKFNQEKWDAVTASCPFHKLAYKRSKDDMEKMGTYYQYIINNK
jgi:hypothetical protein